MRQLLDKYLFVLLWFAMALAWAGGGIWMYFRCIDAALIAFVACMSLVASVNAYISYRRENS